MTSLYIHIPFCEQKCFYCSFVISIGQTHRIDQYLDCLEREAKQYDGTTIGSIYIGGGTPSHMNIKQLEKLFRIVKDHFHFSEDVEWTIEANPEDGNDDKLEMIKRAGVNRVSLGVQTLNDKYLKYLGRNHDSKSATQALTKIQKCGFRNISVDLMFSFPDQSNDELKKDIEQIAQLGSDHISLYALTIEEPSKFYAQNVQLKNDQDQAEQYVIVCDDLADNGFLQYEVSNFAKPQKESQHNLNYWQGGHYIGLGIGAHSHLGNERSWNVAQLNEYMARIMQNKSVREDSETLTPYTQMKEAVLFGLRMNKGINLDQIKGTYGCFLQDNEREKMNEYIKGGLLIDQQGCIKASPKGRLVLDEICAQLA